MRIVVNYYAPVLLTNELMPLLKKGADSRIINLSSAAQTPPSRDIFLGNTSGSERDTYGQSKLALTMWSFDLAQKLENISVIAVNPGSLLDTKMVHAAFGQVWAPAEKGVNILYDLAVSDTYRGVTGKYYDNDRGGFGKAHPKAYDQNAMHDLIRTTNSVIMN